MVRVAEPLTVEVFGRAEAVEEQPFGADALPRHDGQDLVDPAAVLARTYDLAQHATGGGVQLAYGRFIQAVAGRDRHRQRIDIDVARSRFAQLDSHGEKATRAFGDARPLRT